MKGGPRRKSGLGFAGLRPSMRSIESGTSSFNIPMSKKARAYKISEEEAVQVSKRIYDHYDRDRNSNLGDKEIVKMMKDAYRGIDPNFQPTAEEIEEYRQILDQNGDGLQSVDDLELVVMGFFCQTDDDLGYSVYGGGKSARLGA